MSVNVTKTTNAIITTCGGCSFYKSHCYNCGARPAVSLPRWAVESIRSQASWVGRRYYPGDEDREINAERRALLSLVTTFPGRNVEPSRKYEDGEWLADEGRWDVKQATGKGSYMQASVCATSAEEAMEASRFRLRYIPDGDARIDAALGGSKEPNL